MTKENERPEPRIVLRPGEIFRPFEIYDLLKPDQNFLTREFCLENTGNGQIDFQRTMDEDINSFVSWCKNKGWEVVSPYGVIPVEYIIGEGKLPQALTPCEVDVGFDLPTRGNLPVCILEFPSCNQTFRGITSRRPRQQGEKIWFYTWLNDAGKEVVPLYPANNVKVLRELTIRFLAYDCARKNDDNL